MYSRIYGTMNIIVKKQITPVLEYGIHHINKNDTQVILSLDST